MKKDSKIYVCGHTGLVGSSILRKLQNEGFENIVTETHTKLDLTNQKSVEEFFRREKPEYVFLAAAKVGGILANARYRGEFIYQNLMIQTNVLHMSYIYGVKKLLFLGSSCIYPKHAPQPIREEYLMTGPLEPSNSPYAVAKIAGIEMCHAYNTQYNTSFIPVLPTNIYGPNDHYDLENSHVLPALIRKFHLAKLAADHDMEGIIHDEKCYGPIPTDIKSYLDLDPLTNQPLSSLRKKPKVVLWGSGTPRREFLHADDLADACIHIINSLQEKCAPFILNIGTGKDISVKELAELIARIVGFDGELVWDSTKPDGTPLKLLDVSCVEKSGWQAKISLEEGIRSTYKDYLQIMN